MRLSPRQAMWLAAAAACLVYAHSLANGWAGDDPLVIQRNARAHSIGGALEAWFQSYWPPPWEKAGLYRPLSILSFGIEWTVSAGRPWLFHVDNVLLHGFATALVVILALAWVPPAGALVAGLVFAVHPLHVEAVANVVGRSELLAAIAILAAVLLARRYRSEPNDRRARGWFGGACLVLAAGLFSKETAIVAIGFVVLDAALRPVTVRRSPVPLVLAIAGVTTAWWFLWHGIVGAYVSSGATTAFYGLSTGQRLTTMLPVQLDVMRLLVWPISLASDYGPLTVELRREWSALAILGVAVTGSLVALGLSLARRAPAVSFGILAAAGSYLPTSNLLFTSGVVLSERGLYLAVLAPALSLGWGLAALRNPRFIRLGGVAVAVILAVFAGRTMTRVPYWESPRSNILSGFMEHPENYRSRVYLGDLYAATGDSARALAEYLAAGALAENDPFSVQFVVRTAVSVGRPELAVAEARRALAIAPHDSRAIGWLTEALVAAGQLDSALAIAQWGALTYPSRPDYVGNYVWALKRAHAPSWRVLLAQSGHDAISGRLIQAAARMDSLTEFFSRDGSSELCGDLVISVTPLRLFEPDLLERAKCGAGAASGGLPPALAK